VNRHRVAASGAVERLAREVDALLDESPLAPLAPAR
jgi:hypothetical protein